MSSAVDNEVRGLPFFVDTRPYCLWDTNTAAGNLEVVRGLRPDYFSFLARTLQQALGGPADEASAAAMGLRVLYGHVTETLVAYALASIQAGHCIHAWLDKYSMPQLISLCEKVTAGKPFPTMLKAPIGSWSDFSQRIFSDAPEILRTADDEGRAHRSVVEAGTAHALARIAADLCSEDARGEYNSFKHGLRVIHAGFAATIELKDRPPIDVPGSSFGTLLTSAIPAVNGDKINVRVERRFTNWDPHKLAQRIYIAVACLDCVKSFLIQDLTLNTESVRWRFFASEDDYKAPWLGGPRLMSGKLPSLPPPSPSFPLCTREEIHERYKWPMPAAGQNSKLSEAE